MLVRDGRADTGILGVYVGTREENLAACVEICVEQIAEIAAGRLRDGELERAKESLKGRIAGLERRERVAGDRNDQPIRPCILGPLVQSVGRSIRPKRASSLAASRH